MKTTIIPAQITTVEDKIAGNLSFAQILLFLAALFLGTGVYIFLPAPMKFTLYKIPVIAVLSGIFLILSIRIKGRIILNWISIISSYYLRPRFYLFNKNDITNREIIFEEKKVKKTVLAFKKAKAKKKNAVTFGELQLIEQFVKHQEKNIRLRFKGKGGIDVSIS